MNFFKKIIFLIFFFNNSAFCMPCQIIEDSLSASYGLNPKAIQSARAMLDKNIGGWKLLCKHEPVELVKKLNAIVFNFCKYPPQGYALLDINNLFSNCLTACGGRSYVLRGLLAVYGLKSKYQNINNIPIQGNHSAVQVTLDRQEGFLDPTFGTYFTSENVNGRPLALNEIKYLFNENELVDHVYQAKEISDYKFILNSNLKDIYRQNFKSEALQLSSYIENETISNLDPDKILYLGINISMKDKKIYTLGCMDAKSSSEASQCFLNQTNALYSHKNVDDYISYNVSTIGYSIAQTSQMKVNILNLTALNPSAYYKMDLLIDSKRIDIVKLNLTAIRRGIILSSQASEIKIKPGLDRYSIFFRAKKNSGAISLYPVPGEKWTASIYGINIQESPYMT